jgi:hypothetical protein
MPPAQWREYFEPVPKFAARFTSLAAARLKESSGWQINGLQTPTGSSIVVRLASEYLDVGQPIKLPGRLVADVHGTADSLSEALTQFSQVLALIAPAVSLAVNGHVPEFEYQLAYDDTPEDDLHEFRQWFRPGPGPLARPGQQLIDPDLCQGVLSAVLESPEGARAYRACVQYQEALGAWTAGMELRAVMHLWMAVEALTKAFLRLERDRQKVDDDGLCKAWAIEKKQLDSEVRRRLIFHGDSDCYRTTHATSDGLEHMFEDFPKLQKSALKCRKCASEHVRLAVFELVGIAPEHLTKLLAPPHNEPVTLVSLDRSVVAELSGKGGTLARHDRDHPVLENWNPKIVGVSTKGEGFEVSIEDNMQWALGEDVQGKVTGFGTAMPATGIEFKVTKAPTPD